MKRNLLRISAAIAIGLIVVCASVTPVAAQSAFSGKFTLSSEVRWQNVTLPAGDYTFSLKSTALPAQIIVRGPNGAAIVLTSSTKQGVSDDRSYLIVERRGSTRFIREMHLAALDMHLRYGAPALSKDEQQLAQGPATTEQVLIATTKYIHK